MARKLPTKREHRIEYRPLSGIRADPRNPKAHEVSVIDGSMRRFGFIESIVVDDRTGMLISGHGRTETLAAMHAAGQDPPDGVRVAGDDWEVPVTVGWASADDVEASGALIALNRAGELGGWVDQSLLDSLERLRDVTDLDGVGYDEADIALLAGRLAEEVEPPFVEDPDRVPVAPAVPFSRLGDVWELGPHRLVCGNSDDPAVLDALMQGGHAGCILTDPPYGIALDTNYSKAPRGSSNSKMSKVPTMRDYSRIVGDESPFNAGPTRTYFSSVKEQFWFGANYYRGTLSPDDLDGSWLVWDKRTADTDDVIGSGFELLWSAVKHQQRILRHYWCGAFGGAEARNRSHPTQKPTALLSDILTRWAKSGCVVVDPFAGSGPTLIACHLTGCVARLIELDPQYVDVICRRYQEATGTLPTRNGEPHDFTTD